MERNLLYTEIENILSHRSSGELQNEVAKTELATVGVID